MKKVLFIAAHIPGRSPSQRFRFEQYFDFLSNHGYHCKLSYLISEIDDKYLYADGYYVYKFWIFIKSAFRRFFDILRAFNKTDIVFIQREGFMTGTTLFEKLFSLTNAKIIFDFDDSIWMTDDSPVNSKLSFLKNPEKTAISISLSDMVFAGNEYLAEYASNFSNNVKIVPTTIDTNEYVPHDVKNEKIVIGWSGSFTTVKHFEMALPALEQINLKYGDRVLFKLVGDGSYENKSLSLKGIAWSKKDELKELSKFDIGIMPLPDDEWAKGKCGLKGLQYMALSIATVMSSVGVNSEIIEDGINGFLAKDTAELVEKLSTLIDSKSLREKMGKEGRKTVLDKFSVEANQYLYLKYFNEILS